MDQEDSDELNSQGSEDNESRSQGATRRARKGGSGSATRGEVVCEGTPNLLVLNELREQNLLCDAVIRLDNGEVFPIHRAIISACSTYFRTLFTTTLHANELREAWIPDVTPSAMRGILEYSYLRTITLTPWNVRQVLITADYLCIDGAQKLCCDYIRDHMVIENCIGIMLFARSFACQDLVSDAFHFILRNFVDVAARSEELLKLTMEEFCLIIGEDLLNSKTEEAVWECVLRWVGADLQARKECLAGVLRHVRLGLLDTHYFLEKVKDHEYVVGNISCRPIIIETLRFLYDLEMITQKDTEVSTPEIARPRVPHEILFSIGGWSGASPTDYIESYDTRADRWIKVEEVDPKGPRAYHGTAVLGHNIYVIGGFNGRDYFSSCRCFDAMEKTWIDVAPMNDRRCYVAIAVLDDIIYALGGFNGHDRHNSGEVYDHSKNQWTLIASMNMKRSDASATALDGKIYITGGFNGQECMNTVEVYDPAFNQWTFLSPMRSRRSGVSCTAFHNCIYVVGGYNGISRMCSGEKYNPASDQWTPIPDMYSPRSNFAVEVIDDLLFAIGGFNGNTTISHVECFDENLNEWFEATGMNIFRSALSACVVRDLPNLSDYTYQHRDRLMEEKRLRLIAQERAREDMDDEDEEDAEVQTLQNGVNPEDNAEQLRQPGPLLNRILNLPMVHMGQQAEENQGNQAGRLLVAVVGMNERQIAMLQANGLDDDNPFDLDIFDDDLLD